MLLSYTTLQTPISPVRRTCVPPHKFPAERSVADRDDANLVAILLAEERHGAGLQRLVDAHHVGAHLVVGENRVIDQPLDLLELLAIDGAIVGEVEAKPRGLDDAAGLLHMRAENIA